ncbi:MAG: 4-alpha-glucanotransferase [Proteobacteria bacterium]|nr:MAG: 4-alpha-glucanotransferase [Pseudomonadota bacterium]
MSGERPALRALAERRGIASFYHDIAGRERATSDATREALLAGMRIDASSEAAAARALAALDASERDAVVDPVLVWREFEDQVPEIPLAAPPGDGPLEYEVELRLESGERVRGAGRVAAGAQRPVRVALPRRPEPGYHDVVVRVARAGSTAEGSQRFVMAPRTAHGVRDSIGDARVFGFWTNLYTIRSRRNWGFGDATDLAGLVRWCGAEGGAFVGLNPLHAIPSRGTAITPYSPSSRLYRNVSYVDVEAVPEWSATPAAQARVAAPAFAALLARLRAGDAVDHEAVLDAKLDVLRLLFDAFRAARRERPDAPRAAAFAAYVAREGAPLRDFATWEVLADHFASQPGAPATAWRQWPEAYRSADAPAVESFRREHADAIEFRAWLQFELAEQLARAAAAGRAAGLPIGLYQDLAVGSSGDSADTWMAPTLFAEGISVGAPPDDYAPDGQDWGFPPFDPHRLRADGYRFYAQLLRASFESAGALRIDHAMGLLRLFWIPHGRPGRDGTYVRYAADELFGVLALESRRASALVIAEDLGTVPDEFRPLLVDWGILSSSVLYFERDDGVPKPAARISPRALATVQTHDLVPLAGWADGSDLALRREVGLLADDAALARARAERAEELRAWIARLRAERCLADGSEPDLAALMAALHAFLARTPAPLVGVSLDDLAGEREPVNVPGVPVERHPSWTRRMRLPLEAIGATPLARAVLAALASRRTAGAQPGAGERRDGGSERSG